MKDTCTELDLICCVDPFRNACPWQKIAYFRLHGFGRPTMYNYVFSDIELKKVRDIVEKFKTAYVLFNNVEMYSDALRFLKLL